MHTGSFPYQTWEVGSNCSSDSLLERWEVGSSSVLLVHFVFHYTFLFTLQLSVFQSTPAESNGSKWSWKTYMLRVAMLHPCGLSVFKMHLGLCSPLAGVCRTLCDIKTQTSLGLWAAAQHGHSSPAFALQCLYSGRIHPFCRRNRIRILRRLWKNATVKFFSTQLSDMFH